MKGNQFWKARSKHGRNKIWEDPEKLRDACYEYINWYDNNPLTEAVTYQGVVMPEQVPKMRAMTIGSLCIYLGISKNTWCLYRSRPDFMDTAEEIEGIIRAQKFEGAAAGLLNPNIIARDLGLTEKTENEHTGKDGRAIEHNVGVTITYAPVGKRDK